MYALNKKYSIIFPTGYYNSNLFKYFFSLKILGTFISLKFISI